MNLSTRFTNADPICVAQGRYGEVVVVQGNGTRPVRWTQSQGSSDAGIDAPASKPEITKDDKVRYYIARTDVSKPGAVYNSAPSVKFSPSPKDTDQPTDSQEKGRDCVTKSYLNQSSVGEVVVEDGGKYYAEPPAVEIGDSHGKGGVITARLDGYDRRLTEGNDLKTGLTGFQLVSNGPPWPEEEGTIIEEKVPYGIFNFVDVELRNTYGYQTFFGNAFRYDLFGIRSAAKIMVSGITQGSGAKCRIFGTGWSYDGFTRAGIFTTYYFKWSTGIGSVVALNYGSGYTKDDDITIRVQGIQKLVYDDEASFSSSLTEDQISGVVQRPTDQLPRSRWIRPAPAGYDAVIKGYTGDDPANPDSVGYSLRDLKIENPGSGYTVTPQIQIISPTGFGAYATCTTKDGKLDTVKLENAGGGYKSLPEIKIVAGEAEASAIARPHLRGLYQCYYRYVDDTSEDLGGPIASNLSEVCEVDTGDGTASIAWTLKPPAGRAKNIELWRSTGDQAITLYKVTTIKYEPPEQPDEDPNPLPPVWYLWHGNPLPVDPNAPVEEEEEVPPPDVTFTDDLTDDELRDPDREDYEAMPIIMPNGDLNAMRHELPPSDKSSVVSFQDRFWYRVGGENPNAIYFSEEDLPESVPDINEIIPMQSSREPDAMTALVPLANFLLLCQRRNTYSLAFSSDPLADANVSLVASRGCLNQRCFARCDEVCYLMDETGVYTIDKGGSVQDISQAIGDQFQDKIDFSSDKWFFVNIDPTTKILRCFVNHVDDKSTGKPTRAFCYSIAMKTWWAELYPQKFSAATNVEDEVGGRISVVAGTTGLCSLDKGAVDIADGTVLTAVVTNGGSGYKTPPTVYPIGEGSSCHLQAALDPNGSVTAVWILNGGTGYTGGDLYFSPPDDTSYDNPTRATGTFTASPLGTEHLVSPVMLYRSGNREYASDVDGKGFDQTNDRSISLTYTPQKLSTNLSLRSLYNGSEHPRPNVVESDRGNGWKNSTVDPAARIDIGEEGRNEGVATSKMSGQSFDDFGGSDNHVAVELVVPRRTEDPVEIYTIETRGTKK